MSSVQLGSVLSLNVIETVGPAGAAWLRLSIGALVFLAVSRPPSLRQLGRRDIQAILGLGAGTGVQGAAFLGAIERIPLGTAVAVSFLGPLTVAALRSRTRRALLWPALALVGVVLVTEPWRGRPDAVGLGFATSSAACWAIYIVLTQVVADRFSGVSGLSLTVPVAAITAAVVGIPQAVGHLSVEILMEGAGLALLMPVVPFAFELLALRRMTNSAFGTLMAVEPAIGVLFGILFFNQVPSLAQVGGIVLVVLAGAAGQRLGSRESPGPSGSAAESPLEATAVNDEGTRALPPA